MSPAQPDRPRPVVDRARIRGRLVGAIGATLTALVGLGVLTVDQGTAAQSLIVALGAVASAVSALVTGGRVAADVEPVVTPVADPQDDAGHSLVPAPPPPPPHPLAEPQH